MKTIKSHVLLVLSVFALYVAAYRTTLTSQTGVSVETQRDEDTCSSSLAAEVSKHCGEINKIDNQNEFMDFSWKFSKLNECLRKNNHPELQLAEETCEKNGILHANVAALGKLMDRMMSGGIICTIEFSSRILHLHNQLVSIESVKKTKVPERKLLRILRYFARQVAETCASSVADRLLEVEHRADDANKHLGLVVGILNIDFEHIKRIPFEVWQFVPILQSELMATTGDESTDLNMSLGHSKSGFEFPLTPQVGMTIDMLKISCEAIRPFANNILGSLGILASVGYYPRTPVPHAPVINKWMMSAIICQSLKTVNKMVKLGVEGKPVKKILVSHARTADVTWEEETDEEFASFELVEAERPFESDSFKIDKGLEEESAAIKAKQRGMNLRKFQLINGPNHRLANAVNAYLDLKQSEDRINIPYRLLGSLSDKVVISDEDGEDDDDE